MDNQRHLYQHQHIQTDSKGDSKRWIRSQDLGPISKLFLPWRHYQGNIGVQRWMAFVLIWGSMLTFASLVLFLAREDL